LNYHSLGAYVIDLDLLIANGDVIHCSRTQRSDVFHAARTSIVCACVCVCVCMCVYVCVWRCIVVVVCVMMIIITIFTVLIN